MKFGEFTDKYARRDELTPGDRAEVDALAEALNTTARTALGGLFKPSTDAIRAIADDLEHADDAGRHVLDRNSARHLRARSTLIIRCSDCRGGHGELGRVIAHVTYVEGRALLWAATPRGERDERMWLDGKFWGARAWCRDRNYLLPCEYLSSVTPKQGLARAEIRVAHTFEP